jgi:hypothetical protein
VAREDGAAAGSRLWRIMGYSQEHTSIKLAAQAASSATVSTTWTRSPDVLKVVAITAKTSGDSSRGVSGFIFHGIQESFTTQGQRPKRSENRLLSALFDAFSSGKAVSTSSTVNAAGPHLRVNRSSPG